jgi:hypothetical protein
VSLAPFTSTWADIVQADLLRHLHFDSRHVSFAGSMDFWLTLQAHCAADQLWATFALPTAKARRGGRGSSSAGEEGVVHCAAPDQSPDVIYVLSHILCHSRRRGGPRAQRDSRYDWRQYRRSHVWQGNCSADWKLMVAVSSNLCHSRTQLTAPVPWNLW